MSVWQRTKNRIRRQIANLLSLPNDPERIRIIQVPLRHAGVVVDHDTAMKFSAVFRAVSYISNSLAILPWDVLLQTDEKTRKLMNHPAWRLLRVRPNPEMSALTWRQTMMAWALSWGNGYAEIERNNAGQPIALWPISPDRVEVKRWDRTGEIYYKVHNYMGGTVEIEPEDMFHLHGLGFDGLVGYSVISLGARSIALGMATESYAEDFFANGAVTTGALKHPRELSSDAKKRMRDDLNAVVQGPKKRFNIPIFEEGMEWIDMSINPEDAQLILTRKFSVNDIARWFGLPPHKLADLDRSTNNNIEHQSIEVNNDCFMPWICSLEQEANYKLLRSSEKGVITKLNPRGLLRGDDKARAEYYRIMVNIGAYSINDVRRLEDFDPTGSEGDELLVQLNQTTLKKLVAMPAPAPNALPAPKEPDQESTETETMQARQSYFMLFEDAENRILRREIGQFERDKAKFQGKNGDFAAWLNEFYAKNETYMRDALSPIATSMILSLAPKMQMNGNLTEQIDSFLSRHIERSKVALSAYLAGGKDEFWPENRARNEAMELIESLMGLIS